jgi:hypothetical protein
MKPEAYPTKEENGYAEAKEVNRRVGNACYGAVAGLAAHCKARQMSL